MTDISRRCLLRGGLILGAVGSASLLAGCESAVGQLRQASRGSGARGGTLVVGTPTDVDPKTIYSQSITSMNIGLLLWDTLIRYDHKTLQPTPSVATAWEFSADKLSLRLHLRDDVRYHSGRLLNADDVAYNIAKYADQKSGSQLQSTAAKIIHVDTADPSAPVLHFEHPIVNIFDLLEFMLLTDKETEKELAAGEKFIGTGPFRFTGRETGYLFETSRNETYWGGPAQVAGVTIRVVRDANALLTSVRSQQTSIVLDASPQDLRPFGDETLYRVESLDVYDVAYYLGINVGNSALTDKRVRQAISYAIDRERVVKEVLVGRGFVSCAPWAKSSPAFSDDAARHYARNLERSRSLLAEAGYRGGSPLLLSYGSGSPATAGIAGIIQNNLAEIGVDARLDPREQASYNPFLKSKQHQLWISPHGFGQSSPVTLATGAAPFKPAGNLSQFTSEEYTAAVNAFADVVDPTSDEAKQVYQRFTDILLDEQFISDIAISTWTTVAPVQVKGVKWSMYKNVDAHRATVR
ncbi:MAG: ABC transporter substrate-binding protein [Gordonia sp. (in: high G+C Gram-positive bacteria)]